LRLHILHRVIPVLLPGAKRDSLPALRVNSTPVRWPSMKRSFGPNHPPNVAIRLNQPGQLFLRRLDLERIWYVVFVVLNSLLFGQHALMQDTANQDTAGFLPVKHNMLALLHAPQPRANFITLLTERGIIGKELGL
jgi:hypothetical protein